MSEAPMRYNSKFKRSLGFYFLNSKFYTRRPEAGLTRSAPIVLTHPPIPPRRPNESNNRFAQHCEALSARGHLPPHDHSQWLIRGCGHARLVLRAISPSAVDGKGLQFFKNVLWINVRFLTGFTT